MDIKTIQLAAIAQNTILLVFASMYACVRAGVYVFVCITCLCSVRLKFANQLFCFYLCRQSLEDAENDIDVLESKLEKVS